MAEAGLAAWLRQDHGLDIVAIDPVGHGADVAAELWRAVGDDGTVYAVKLTGGGSEAGLTVPAYLAGLGIAGVLAPVPTRSGAPWSDRSGRRLSVTPWAPGQRAVAPGAMTAAHWRSFGTLLGAVHAAPVAGALADLPREDYTHTRAAALVAASDGLAAEPDVDPEAAAAWRAARPRTISVLAGADELAEQLRQAAGPVAACHADPHLGNVIAGPDGQVYLVDWDDAVLAPPERDLMFFLDWALMDQPVTAEHLGWFGAGYGRIAPDPARLAYARCTRAVEDVAGWAEPALSPGTTPAERAAAIAIIRSNVSPDGILTVAARSLADRPCGSPAHRRDNGRRPQS